MENSKIHGFPRNLPTESEISTYGQILNLNNNFSCKLKIWPKIDTQTEGKSGPQLAHLYLEMTDDLENICNIQLKSYLKNYIDLFFFFFCFKRVLKRLFAF